jgi:ubiquinone/menaquinone biosynthesis C-methylase UbiE
MKDKKFTCINCNGILIEKYKELFCTECKKTISKTNGYYDFLKEDFSKEHLIKKNVMKFLMEEINKYGYNTGTKNFVKKYPKYKMKFLDPRFDQSIDSIFHCLGKNNNRCLVLGSGFGNKTEILSHIFNEIYSIEIMEELLIFQNKRFFEAGITNVISLKSEIERLPFTEDFFDLIVIDQTFFDFIEIYSKNEQNTELVILNELKRVLTKKGCLCFGIENNSKYNFLFGRNSTKKKNKNILDLKEILRLVKKSGFQTKTYWTLPSNEKPYFSSNLEDGLATKWYFENYKNFIKGTKNQLKYVFFFKILLKLNQKMIKIFTKKLAPYFVLYCYKENIQNSIEDFVLKETNFSSCFSMSRRIKTVFILIDNLGKAKHIVHFRRYGKKFPDKIPEIERIFPDMKNPESRIWMEEWKNGRTLNPFNSNEVIQAILWLFKFQNESFQDRLKKEELEEEIIMIKENLNKRENLNKIQYENWIKDYEKFLTENIIKKSAQHGDFAFANLLFDPKTNTISPIDWENFSLSGSPFKDLMDFIIRLMIQSSKNEVATFREKIQDENEFKDLMFEIEKLLDEHFKCNIDINLIIRYAVLKKVAELIKIKKESANTYIELLKILENKNFKSYRNEKINDRN